MSPLPPKQDIDEHDRHVRFVPVSDQVRRSYQTSGSTTDLVFDRSNAIGHPIARLNAFESRFICQSPRAICSALKKQSSLDGIPHRSQRSQSPQTKSTGFEEESLLANSPRIFRMT
jgi:hypothetical protein